MATITWLDKIDGLDLLDPQKNVSAADMNQIKTTVNTNDGSFTSHTGNTSNPHSVTKTQVGLGNVDNTSDADKPVSTAQATAIGVVQSDVNTHEALINNPHSVTKAQVGLSNVDNTSDVDKPVSTAQQDALDLKSDIISFVDNEVPDGDIDSVNVTFTLFDIPISGSLKLFWNGIKQRSGVGYTISTNIITMTTPPDTGDTLEADYRT